MNAAQGQRMEFTKEERRMLAWLRHQHENWRIKRLFQLAAAIACLLYSISVFVVGNDLGIFIGITGFYILSRTIGSWHGKPEISLLLKLIDDRQEKERPCGLANCCKHKQTDLLQ